MTNLIIHLCESKEAVSVTAWLKLVLFRRPKWAGNFFLYARLWKYPFSKSSHLKILKMIDSLQYNSHIYCQSSNCNSALLRSLFKLTTTMLLVCYLNLRTYWQKYFWMIGVMCVVQNWSLIIKYISTMYAYKTHPPAFNCYSFALLGFNRDCESLLNAW